MTRSADPAADPTPNPGLEITPNEPSTELSTELSWRLPAALLYIGGPDVQSRDWESFAGRLEELLPGLHRAAPGILACTVSESIANTLDTTLELGLDLLQQEQDSHLPTLARLVLLVAPGFVESHKERWILDDRDPLIKALAQRPTLDLEPGLYVSSRAVHTLEGHWATKSAGSWSTRSLAEVPLQRVSRGSAPGRPQVRNSRIFGRRIEWVPRRQSERALSEALATGRVRVQGPLGSGKSRLVSEVLSQPRGQAIVTVTPSRSGAPLQERLAMSLEHVLEGLFPSLISADKASVESTADFIERLQAFAQQHPLCLVFDDLQRSTAEDMAYLEKFLDIPVEPDRLTILLAGRTSTAWGPRAGSLLGVEVPMLSTDATFLHASRVCEGLEMPQDVIDRFSQSAGGSPFCFEEGILELIHRRALRRVYGSFFFGAPNDIDLTPSSRFVGHLLEESRRSGTTLVLVTLASRGGPVPVDSLQRVAASLGAGLPSGWADRPPVADWVVPAETPWGPGIDFAASSLRSAFDSLLAPTGRKKVRAALGADLGPLPSTTPEARWLAYELMAGSPGAIEVLLQILRPLPPTERR
ncbi:MAG: ATP-binding protein, partial [Thermoanaerobaculia bacterium]|nr:ATP-binding protein [Thermoanaerobaculia bacterium]